MLGREIALRTELEDKEDRLIKGRQLLWLVYHHFRLTEEAGGLYDLNDLMAVKLKGDQSLDKFMANWDSVLAGMRAEPPEEVRKVLFYNQVKNSQVLRTQIERYRLADVGHEDKTYTFLVKMVRSYLDRKLRENNRNQISHALAGEKIPAEHAKGRGGRGKGRGKGSRSRSPAAQEKGVCYQFQREGNCDREDCKYRHVKEKERSRSPGKGKKGKGRGKGNRSRSPSPKGIPCQFFLSGHCKFAEKCWNKHEGKPSAPASAGKSASPAPKGRRTSRRKLPKRPRLRPSLD